MRLIKNVIVAFFVLIISAAIFFFLVKDQQFTDDILRSTMQLFGEDLMAMVPEGEEKELLKKKFDEFLQRADKEELPPEEIERVAAVILNLTTQDTIVQADEALSALNFKNQDYIYPPTVPFPRQASEMKSVGKRAKGIRPLRPERFDWNEEEKKEIADRLVKVKDFHVKLHKRMQHDSTFKALPKKIMFNSDSGLTVALNLDLKDDFHFEFDPSFLAEMEALEKEKILVWKESIQHQKEMEKALNKFLEHIPTITANIGQMGEVFGYAGKLDSLNIKYNQFFNAESLQKVIEENLKQFEQCIPDSVMD